MNILEIFVFAFFEHGGTVVVRSYPKAVLTVHIESGNACDTRGRIHSFEIVAVISDKTRVTSYPDKALRSLGNGIRFRSRKSVAVVVKKILQGDN